MESSMAQAQRPGQRPNQRSKPSDRRPTPEGDDIPLRDPSEGRAPAVIGQNIAQYDAEYAGDYQEQMAAQQQAPVIGVDGEPIEDGERDPGTVAEEQRQRSEDMQEQGVLAWMAARDSRTPEQIAESQFVPEAEKPLRLSRDNANVIASGGGRFDDEYAA
jgi:hypothetical protein